MFSGKQFFGKGALSSGMDYDSDSGSDADDELQPPAASKPDIYKEFRKQIKDKKISAEDVYKYAASVKAKKNDKKRQELEKEKEKLGKANFKKKNEISGKINRIKDLPKNPPRDREKGPSRARPRHLNSEGESDNENDNIWYRALRKEEVPFIHDVKTGIGPKASRSDTTPYTAVLRGSKEDTSPFVHFSHSRKSVGAWASKSAREAGDKFGTVIRVGLNPERGGLDPDNYIDLTYPSQRLLHGFPAGDVGMNARSAMASQEGLLRRRLHPEETLGVFEVSARSPQEYQRDKQLGLMPAKSRAQSTKGKEKTEPHAFGFKPIFINPDSDPITYNYYASLPNANLKGPLDEAYNQYLAKEGIPRHPLHFPGIKGTERKVKQHSVIDAFKAYPTHFPGHPNYPQEAMQTVNQFAAKGPLLAQPQFSPVASSSSSSSSSSFPSTHAYPGASSSSSMPPYPSASQSASSSSSSSSSSLPSLSYPELKLSRGGYISPAMLHYLMNS